MMCQKWLIILIVFCCLLSLSCSQKKDEGKTVIRIVSVLPQDHPSSKALFRDSVNAVYDKYYEKNGREYKDVCEEITATP